MGVFGLIKDVALLPVNAALDATMLTPAARIVGESKKDTPFGTIDRVESLVKNLGDCSK